MNNSLMPVNPNFLSKTQLSEYVRQMARLESDVYTTEEAIKYFTADIENCNRAIQKIKAKHFEKEEPRPPVVVEKKTLATMIISDFFISLARGLCGGAIIGIIIILAAIPVEIVINWFVHFEFGVYNVLKTAGIAAVISAVIAFFILFISALLSGDTEYEEYLKKCKEYEKQLKGYEEAEDDFYDKCRNSIDKQEQSIRLYETQVKILCEKHSELTRLRGSMYSVDIIPPDYRTMDCVYGLDHIFRNDLADTVRDAILQYEDRVFKGVIIKGMSNILKKVDSLGAGMAYLTSELNRTNSTVASMSNDISRLNQNISRNGETSEKLLNDILKESKATKYATEAMQSQMDYIYRTDYLHLI